MLIILYIIHNFFNIATGFMLKYEKNAIFSDTPEVVFDFDKNSVQVKHNKKTYKLADVLENLSVIINDL